MTYPVTVYLIRHGEKTSDDNNPHLSPEGRARACRLRQLFGLDGRIGRPNFLFAADRSKHSNRSVETLEPLASVLGLEIDHHWDDDEYKDLAKRIAGRKAKVKYQGARILIAWHHES